ncbi:MAG: peroxiredoxin [Natrialbaceae archaeon]|nr:peroxiredoxin [Natrialbaceae archaeon]
MVTTGDTAPDFTAPLANGSIDSITLSDQLETEAPIVLAFYPAAFSGGCTTEMQAFQEHLDGLEAAGGTLYGVSVDLPFANNAFREANELTFDLVCDPSRELIDAYDVRMNFDHLGIEGVAKRSVFVVDADGTIVFDWVSDDPGVEPDYAAVVDAVRGA